MRLTIEIIATAILVFCLTATSAAFAAQAARNADGLTLQLQFLPEMSFARIGLMGSAPRRPCEDIGVRDAPLGKLRGDTADFLDRPADQERRFGRDRSFVFLSDRPVLAR